MILFEIFEISDYASHKKKLRTLDKGVKARKGIEY